MRFALVHMMSAGWATGMARFVLLWGVWTTLSPAMAEERPNIVLIMADDLGYECLSVNGGRSYETPRLDQLAAEGMRFEHCHSQPLCTPSRVQLMTGRYNQRNYLRFGLLDWDETTFAQLLRKSGYATCIAGKWQLDGGMTAPDHFGFDEFCLWQLTRRPGRYPNPGLEINGREVDFNRGEYGPDLVSDFLCDFIERHRDEPFLAYYPMILPHWPFEPTPDSDDWDPKSRGKSKGTGDPADFVDMVKYTDKMVGKIVDKLAELNLSERTILLFTGDNGTATQITSLLHDRKFQGGKGKTIDAGTHVPLIVHWPGTVKPGQVTDALVDFSDFLPTLLDVAQIDRPANLQLDGQSFLHTLQGRPGSNRQSIYCWYERNGGPRGAELARNQRYKLYSDGRFFDVEQDELEKHPLSREGLPADVAAVHAELRTTLDRYAGTRRPLPETAEVQP